MSGNQRSKETAFVDSLDDLFDVAYADTMKLLNIEEDRKFLEAQREKDRRGCMGAVDTKLPQSQLDGQTDKLFENIHVPIPISSHTSSTFRTLTVQCFRGQSLLEGMVRLSICTFYSTTGLGIATATCPVQSNQ